MFSNSGFSELAHFVTSLPGMAGLSFGRWRSVSAKAAGPAEGSDGMGFYARGTSPPSVAHARDTVGRKSPLAISFRPPPAGGGGKPGATSEWIFRLRSALAVLAYRSMVAMRTLSPYLLAALFIALHPSASRAAAPAEIFVQENLDEGYAVLNNGSLSAPERGEKLHALLLRIIDGKRIALFTLGVYARDASNAQTAEFADAFSDFVAAVLVHDIAGNPGAMLTVTGSVERAPDDVIVNALLVGSPRANGSPFNFAFRVRKNSHGDNSIVDVSIEGISMAATQRSDFTAWLRQHHGDIGALVHELRLRARSFREADEARQIGAKLER